MRNEAYYNQHPDDIAAGHDEEDFILSTDDYQREFCGGWNDSHDLKCPENESPFARLLRDGYC